MVKIKILMGTLMDLYPQHPVSSLGSSVKKTTFSQSLRDDTDTRQKRRQAIDALKTIGDLYPLNPGAAGISGMLARGRR